MNKLRNIPALLLIIVVFQFTSISNVVAVENEVDYTKGGSSTIILTSDDGNYSIKTEITSIKKTDTQPGQIIFKADLLKTTNDINKIEIKVNRVNTTDFRFNSNTSNAGLFATAGEGAWTSDDKMAMMKSGKIDIKSSEFAYIIASRISFSATNDEVAILTPGEVGTLFCCNFPVNPNCTVDWTKGFSNSLQITCTLRNSNDTIAELTSDAFDFPVAKENSEQLTTYSAYLQNPSDKMISAGGTFTADVYAKASDGNLEGCQLSFDCEGGTIQSVVPNGLQYADNQNGTFTFYGNTENASNGVKVATVTVGTDETASGQVTLSIKSGTVATVTGVPTDQTMALPDEGKSVTVSIKDPDHFNCTSYAAGKYLLQYTGTVESGKMVKYTSVDSSTDMFYSSKYNSWICLVNNDISTSLENSDFNVVEGTTFDSVIYGGDVNRNGTTNIMDAQIAYDLANSVYTDFDLLKMENWLEADVNGVNGVTAEDARAIQCIIHGITE